MNKRNTQQRRHLIVSQLQQQGELSVEQLAEQFNTSEVTIRKDLTVLEQAGLLLRRYGGAVPVPQDFVSDSSLEKVSNRKLAIAKAAASLIKDHYRIIIDSGRTTAALLPELASKRGLNPPSLTSDDRDVQEMRRELMHIFLEGVAQNTIVPVRDSSTRPEGTASMPRSESPPAHSGGQYLRILMQIFKVRQAVAMLPVFLLKTVLSDQPPWCGEHHEPGPRDDAPPGSPAHSRSVLTSAWRSIEDILEALSFDPSV